MAEIICVIGNKGGTGKTTLSHMLCQGLGLLGQRAACVLTDTTREPLVPAGRRYLIADARTRDSLTKVVDKLRTLDDWIGVIDGGGNRTEMDRKLYALSDIVLLPFRESHEDIRTVLRDLEMFPRAYAIPTQWPTNPWQREAADRSVSRLLGAHRHRIRCAAVHDLRRQDAPGRLVLRLRGMWEHFRLQLIQASTAERKGRRRSAAPCPY